MPKSRILRLLLLPSLLSFFLSASLAILLLVGSNWEFLIRSPLLSDYFFGPNGLVTVMQNSSGSLNSFWEAVVAGPFTYNILVLVVAAVVGLTVYAFLEGFDHLAARTNQTLSDMHDANKAYSRAIKMEAGVRLSVRAVSLVLWLVYWAYFSKIILPFSLLVFRTGLEDPFTAQGIQYNAIGIVVLILGFHLHVVLLRFIALRVRIFGVKPELYT